MLAGRFRRADRLRSSKDYRRVGREGRRLSSASFVVLVAPQGTQSPGGRARLGITVSRRVGNAVTRNRVKRQIREWFRQHVAPQQRLDLVVIARPSARWLRARDVERELSSLLPPVAATRRTC